MSDTKIPKTFVDRWNAAAADKTVTSAEFSELEVVAKKTPEQGDDTFITDLQKLRASASSFDANPLSSVGYSLSIPKHARDANMSIDGVAIEFFRSGTDSDSCTFTAQNDISKISCFATGHGIFANGEASHSALNPTKPKIDWQKLGYLYTGWSRAAEGSAHSHGLHYDLSVTHPSIAAPFITPALRLDAELAISSPAFSLAAGPGLRIGVPVFCEGYAHVMGSAHILRADGETSKGFSMYSVFGVQALYFYGEGMFPVSGSDSLSRGKGFSLGVRSAF